MLKKNLFVVFLGIILILGLFLYVYQKKSRHQEQENTYTFNNNDMDVLQEGDIIFRHGFGLISDAIVNLTKEIYSVSHCGILCKDTNNQWIVIHTVSNTLADIDGMQSDDLTTFVKNSKRNSIVIVRYKATCDSTNTLFTKQAFYYLHQQIPFDDKFDMKDTAEFFCTELIRQLFIDVYHRDIYHLNSDSTYHELRFSPFWDTCNFEVTLSHQIPEKK